MTRLIIWMLLGTATIGLAGSAHAMFLCGRKDASTGRVKEGVTFRARTTCRPNEVALPLSFEDAGATVRFTGVNVQIVSGAGATDAAVNGRGNLIIGYDEMDADEPLDRSGSHNLVVGPFHTYSSYAGAAIGNQDFLTGPFAFVTGEVNEASGSGSSAVGGALNHATQDGATVIGGALNEATGAGASVFGGQENVASGASAVVVGGRQGTATGGYATVAGGRLNKAAGETSSVSGGNGVTQSTDGGWSAGSLGATSGATGFSSP